jgi:hypothetical protein
MLTCKAASYTTLYEWVADFSRNGGVIRVVQSRRMGKKSFSDT